MHTLISLEYKRNDEANNLTRPRQMKLDSQTYVPDRNTEKHKEEVMLNNRSNEDRINNEVNQNSKSECIGKPQVKADSEMNSNTTTLIGNLYYRLKKMRKDFP